MQESPSPRRSVREENRRSTRDRIIAAAVDCVRGAGHSGFSMPEVARSSGVSLRTLYRYFPKRQDLVDALALIADQVDVGPRPSSIDDLAGWLTQAWRNLLDEEALLRAQHDGPEGAAIRRARVPRHRSITEVLVDHECPNLDSTTRADIVDSALLVTSSTALFEFIDVLEIDVDRGARIAAMTVRALLSAHR